MSAVEVYLYAACSTPVTNRPQAGFYELCLEVGREALADMAPRRIDSFYVASMDPALYGVTGEVAASLSAELGLMPKEVLGIRGTSSAGGIGLIPAYKDIASGLYDHALVISCEQMNRVAGRKPTPEQRAQERKSVAKLLRGVIDPEERKYGLTMILMGDLFEKALLRRLNMSKDAFRDTIGDVTMAMYGRAAQYPFAHFYGKSITREQYDAARWVSPHYRLDDVVPVSTGACAIVLSSSPPKRPRNGRLVRLRGFGQGVTHPALTRRRGPVTAAGAVRRALKELARRTDQSPSGLRAVDIGFPHDAFPSITRTILLTLGFSHEESIAGLVSGRFNPCGGLVKCGHPVGCSGELQLVRAFQQLTYDEASIPRAIQRDPADTAFTVSVGAVLTNIVATYLEAHDASRPPPRRGVEAYDEARFDAELGFARGYERYAAACGRIAPGASVVLSNTRSELGWVNLLQDGERKTMALSDDELELGALVRVDDGGALARVGQVLADQVEPQLLADLGIVS